MGSPPDPDGMAYIIDACDKQPGDLYGFTKRLMSEKDFIEISEAETKIIVSKIQKQLADGERFLEIQMMLSCPRNMT